MTDTPPTLTTRQIATIQSELRAALGLPPEVFPLSSFIGMVSDEIEQLRQRGFSDANIAKVIQDAGRVKVSAEDIGEHYALPEARARASGQLFSSST